MGPLSSLSGADVRFVLINVHTELACTVAVASIRRATDLPVVVVDCDPTPSAAATMQRAMARLRADVVTAPVRGHGETLDWIFTELDGNILFLMDSDAEIRDPQIVDRMLRPLEFHRAFGAGWTLGPRWTGARLGAGRGTGLLMQAPWTPFLALKVQPVRNALGDGLSFRPRTVHNDFRWSKSVSRLLGGRFAPAFGPKVRGWRRVPERVRHSTFPALRWARAEFFGLRPNFFHYDTAGLIFNRLRYHDMLLFAGDHIQFAGDEVHHWGGLTRELLGYSRQQPSSGALEAEMLERLRSVYGLEWPALAGSGPGTVGA